MVQRSNCCLLVYIVETVLVIVTSGTIDHNHNEQVIIKRNILLQNILHT